MRAAHAAPVLALLLQMAMPARGSSPFLICGGKQAPLLAEPLPYIVKLLPASGWTATSSEVVQYMEAAAAGSESFFKVQDTFGMLNAFSATMDGQSILALAAEFPGSLEYIECDGTLYAVSGSKMFCRGAQVDSLPAEEVQYSVSLAPGAKDSAVAALKALPELESISFEFATGALETTTLQATLAGPQAAALTKALGDLLTFIECADPLATTPPVSLQPMCGGRRMGVPTETSSYVVEFLDFTGMGLTQAVTELQGVEFYPVARGLPGVFVKAALSGKQAQALAAMVPSVVSVECDRQPQPAISSELVVMCGGEPMSLIPEEPSMYILQFLDGSGYRQAMSLTGMASVSFELLSTSPDSTVAVGAELSASQVKELTTHAAGLIRSMECDALVSADSTVGVPEIYCNGFQIPLLKGDYIVTLTNNPTTEEIDAIVEWLQAQGGPEYFALGTVVAGLAIDFFSGTFSAEALQDLSDKYGDVIGIIECDGAVFTAVNKLFCQGQVMDVPTSGVDTYLVSVVDDAGLKAVQAQLGDLEAVGYQDLSSSSLGPVFKATLSAETLSDLLVQQDSHLNYVECHQDVTIVLEDAQEETVAVSVPLQDADEIQQLIDEKLACGGKPVEDLPANSSRYIVHVKQANLTAGEALAEFVALNFTGVSDLHQISELDSAFPYLAGELSPEAVTALLQEFGSAIDLIECDLPATTPPDAYDDSDDDSSGTVGKNFPLLALSICSFGLMLGLFIL